LGIGIALITAVTKTINAEIKSKKPASILCVNSKIVILGTPCPENNIDRAIFSYDNEY
jgi:hypothetical protein